ncbi:uncharacterized protein LOC124374370 isoform X2 [Homalodisca vitripennis]|nr:uncharacterized protein LOC124374370 isoform X2 [Homalodisca vitripennis]
MQDKRTSSSSQHAYKGRPLEENPYDTHLNPIRNRFSQEKPFSGNVPPAVSDKYSSEDSINRNLPSNGNKFSAETSLDKNTPQAGKRLLEYSLSDNLGKSVNSQRAPTLQYGNDFQQIPRSEFIMKNNLPQISKLLKSGKLDIGNKLKQKSLQEKSMGNINLPEYNLESSKPDNGMSNNAENPDFTINDQINGGNTDHRRKKRDISKENSETICSSDGSSNIDNSNNMMNVNFTSQNSLDKENKLDDSEIKSDRKFETPMYSQDNKKESVQVSLENGQNHQNNKKLITCTNEDSLSDDQHINNIDFKEDQSGEVGKQPNAGKINKREDNNQINKQTSGEIDKENYIKEYTHYPVDSSVKDIERDEKSQLSSTKVDQNNIKREIHLDTSDKSWQTNENVEKNKMKPEKIYLKNSCDADSSDKLSRENINPLSSIALQTDLENEKIQDIKPSKITRINKDNLSSDEKLMASVLETVVKDMEKTKVKKDVNEGVNNIINAQPSNTYKEQQSENLPKVSMINDNDSSMKVDQVKSVSLIDSPSFQKLAVESKKEDLGLKINDNNKLDVFSRVADDGKKSEFVEKENLKDTVHEDEQKTAAVQNSQEEKEQKNVDEIIIRVKAPEGTISNIEQRVGSDLDNTKKESYDTINGDVKSSIFGHDQNIQLIQNPQKTGKEKSNQGEMNKLEDELSPNSFQEQLKQEKAQQNLNSIFSDTQQQLNVEKNDNSKSKTKRDDTIHLIIETEPEINADSSNSNSNQQKSGLFCQGRNCLEIKPVLLNETNNGTNAENAKVKLVEKRDAWGDDCAEETTTEINLVCFDFFNKMFNLELMITVDYKVVKMHEDDDIENFILTVVNMISTNFYDKSIGVNLNVVLVRLILLATCIKELDSDRFNPEELLENFCTWQVLINPGKDDHPHHHDLAIFVTRMEKCEGQVMGVTYMTSVCRPDKACLVCIDEGLLLANTITHQIGHSLGADHDTGESSGCSETAPDGTNYLMAPTISETSSSWSTCSRDSIIQFLKTQGSWCLTDLPVDKTYNFPLMLPGQIYSAAQQCKLNFHMTALPCAVGAFCEKLYCQVTEKLCATKGDPPADGTFCASDMWCFHKECVHVGRRPGSINGEWGPWTEWSICTRSCGGGVSSSYRICNNPKPENGGRYCIGDRIRHRMCATKPCQGFTESFRDLQCKKTEDRPFRGRLHNWSQYHSFFLNIECALVCQNRKGEVVMRSPIVADGTPCKAGTRNVCIQGTCRNVGCDWVIDSNAKEDSCGVCRGNSTECKIIQGAFDEPSMQKGLVEFLRVPKDSGMIFVREISPSENVLVVTGSINRVFYLNGGGAEDSMPGDIMFGQTHGVYEVRSAMERIFIRGPTSEELVFHVLFREQNKGIHYQYAVMETDFNYVPRYLWQYLDWDPCTDPCSGGSQRAHAKCVEDRGGVVDDQFCTESSRPLDVIRPCNDFPCQAKWWVSVWSDCICTGTTSVMFRSVLCMRATDESGTRSEIVRESECANHKKPATQKACNATEEENDCVNKRSVSGNSMFKGHKDIRRAVNPKIAYATYSSPGASDTHFQEQEMVQLSSDKENTENKEKEMSKENTSLNKLQKKSVSKPQVNKNSSVKGAVSKVKPKSNEKDTVQPDKKKLTAVKSKNADSLKPAVITKNVASEESKSHLKAEDLSFAPEKGKQVANLNAKVAALNAAANNMKHSAESKQSDEGDSSGNSEEANEECETTELTSEDSSCPTAPPDYDTTTGLTCKNTCPVQAHRKTTCCKTLPPKQHGSLKSSEGTTMRPIVVNVDELNMDHFALTVVPLDNYNKKKLPQSDPEFINLGNIGQFGVGNEDNSTIITGQEALDFLEFARSNASEEPAILHETHN